MKKSILYILSLLLLASTYSCKDFLLEESETSFTARTLFETPEGIDKMVVALYDYERGMLRGGNANGFLAAHIYGERTTDLNIFYTGDDANISRYTSPGPSGNIRGLLYSPFWRIRYYIIGRTNEIIHFGQQLGDEAAVSVAEASYWRAFSYYQLYARFGRLYLSEEPITKDNLDEMSYAPADSADVFALMYEDLDRAIAGLGYTPYSNMEGRVTKATALHLKALVAAWAKDWTEVARCVDEIDNDPEHNLSLVPDPANIFNSTNLNTTETLFLLKFSNERGGGTGHRLGEQYVNRMANFSYTWQPDARYNTENLGRATAWAMPNSYLISLYDEDDARLNAFYKRYYTYQNPEALITVPPAQPATDRLSGLPVEHSTYNFTGEPYTVEIGDTIYGRDVRAATNTSFAPRDIYPSSLKMADLWSKPLDASGATASYKDVMIFRLAETYLLGSEAYMHLGDQAKARDYFNRTWTRAGNPSVTGNVTFEMIRDENARELAFEGRRWDFLKRNGIWYQQMRSYAGDFTKYPGSNVPYDPDTYGQSDGRDPAFGPNPDFYYDFSGSDNDVVARFNVQPIHVNWPIPQDQIDAMGPQNFPQTEGY